MATDGLARSSLFQGISQESLRLLAPSPTVVRVRAGQFLLKEGEPATRLFAIVAGQAVLQMKAESALRRIEKTVELTTLGPTDPVGLSALVPPYVYGVSVLAKQDLTCVAVDAETARQVIESDPRLSLQVSKRLVQLLARRLDLTREVLAYERAWRST